MGPEVFGAVVAVDLVDGRPFVVADQARRTVLDALYPCEVTMNRETVTSLIEALSACAVTAGVALYDGAAGLIAGGVLGLAYAWKLAS